MAERGSFIVNPEGKIVAYEVLAGNVGRNADELLRRVQASQFVAPMEMKFAQLNGSLEPKL